MRVEHPLRSAIDLVVHRAPVEAQLVVTRRCNLACGYCSEADRTSDPVPLPLLLRRIDAIHHLHTVSIALLGGEPLLHPDIRSIVAHAHRRSQVSITTNGFLLTSTLVQALNEAGLTNMQVSIDALNRQDDGYIQKTFDRLEPKLNLLCEKAAFATHVTVVLCPESIDHFGELLRRLNGYPVLVSVNVVHDARGAATVSGERYVEAWRRHFLTSRVFSRLEEQYGALLLSGAPPQWHCRAGERSLYIDEFGDVHFCAGQRHRMNCKIEDFTSRDARRYGALFKGCEKGCSVFCVYRASLIDNNIVEAAIKTLCPGPRWQ